MRSGIGPKNDLLAVGIEPIINNPYVGKNVLDHTVFTVTANAQPDDIGLVDPNDLYTGGALLRKDCSSCGNREFEIIGNNPKPGQYILTGVLLTPSTKGEFQIIDNDPLANLAYHFNPLTTESDMADARQLVRLMADLIMISTVLLIHLVRSME